MASTTTVDQETLRRVYEQFLAAQQGAPPPQQQQAQPVMPAVVFPSNDTMDTLFYEWGRSKIQARDVANHALANLAYVDKVAVGHARGLTDSERNKVTPFPSPTSIVVQGGSDNERIDKLTEKVNSLTGGVQQQPAVAPASSADPLPLWKKLLLAGTAGAALTVPPSLAYWLTPRPEGDRTTVIQPVNEGEVDMTIERWKDVPDGG